MQANLIIKGIKCDNPDCNFRNDTVDFRNYRDWLNKPCPKCGSNLLTQKDLNAVKFLIKIINIINGITKPFIKSDGNVGKIIGEMNGTGKIKFKSQN